MLGPTATADFGYPRAMVRASASLGLLALLLAGCASAPPPPAAPARTSADLDGWVVAEAPAATSNARTLSPLAVQPLRIEAKEPPVPRPAGRNKVDVHFQRAEIKQAFQFLADVGNFNLVLDDTLSGQVSARLRGVDAYDALVTLADANGATVRYDRRIVVVRHR